jgi:SNF2 family DNA or RNA helicase
LQKKVLTDLDRKRILSCLANLRMLCDSTWLFDKTTNVSPKLDEFAQLMPELVEEGGHKAVVFSQWELMLEKASERLKDLGIGHAVLHGRVPAKDRRQLLDDFRDNRACRVLLSTDAGGTGLNLQVADTVINLEVPWNPAVLEQRIARVHRMGQSQPVRVILLVTRGSIEERVLKTLEMKRSLFASVFDGDSDEVSFDAIGEQQFLQTVRDLIDEPVESPTPLPVLVPTASPQAKLLPASVQFLEALAEIMTQNGAPLSPDLAERAAAAVKRINDNLPPRE